MQYVSPLEFPTMDIAQKPSDPECYEPLSGPFRFYCTLLEVQKPSDPECYAPLSGLFRASCTLLEPNHLGALVTSEYWEWKLYVAGG
jgi:hypothetical protein